MRSLGSFLLAIGLGSALSVSAMSPKPPSLAMTDDSRLAIAWTELCADCGNPSTVQTARIDPRGSSEPSLGFEHGMTGRNPALAIRPDGSTMLIAWEEGSINDGYRRRIFVREQTPEGEQLGPDIRIDLEPVTNRHRGLDAESLSGPVLAAAADGRFALAYHHRSEGLCLQFDLSLELFSASGQRLSQPIAIASGPLDELDAEVAFDSDGRLLIVWREVLGLARRDQQSRLKGRMIEADGEVGEPFVIAQGELGPMTRPAIVLSAQGRFTLAWTASVAGEEKLAVRSLRGNRFDAVRILAHARPDAEVALVAHGVDRLLVSWRQTSVEHGHEILARALDLDGRASGPPIKIARSDHELGPPAVIADDQLATFIWLESRRQGTAEIRVSRRLGTEHVDLDPPSLTGLGPRDLAWLVDRREDAVDQLAGELYNTGDSYRVAAFEALETLVCEPEESSSIHRALLQIADDDWEEPLWRLMAATRLDTRQWQAIRLLQDLVENDRSPRIRYFAIRQLQWLPIANDRIALLYGSLAKDDADSVFRALLRRDDLNAAQLGSWMSLIRCTGRGGEVYMSRPSSHRRPDSCTQLATLIDDAHLLLALRRFPSWRLLEPYQGKRKLTVDHLQALSIVPAHDPWITPLLHQELTSSLAETRITAMQTLSSLGPVALDPIFREIRAELGDPDSEVATAAVQASEMIESACIDQALE